MKKKHILAYALLAMKITALQLMLSTCFVITLFANKTEGQVDLQKKIKISFEKIEISKVIEKLQHQTDYQFVYSSKAIEADRKISFNTNTKLISLNDFLNEVFKPMKIGFTVIDSKIILYRIDLTNQNLNVPINEEDLFLPPDKIIKGKVVDEKGMPLVGASVKVTGAKSGTITDQNGEFKLSVKDKATTLEVSFTGYAVKKILLGDELIYSITLNSVSSKLDDVVVIGYGTQKKGNLTGSVSTVNADQLTIAPIASVSNALAGQLPGLVSTQSNGLPGSDNATLSIRGFGSPLMIVDGIESSTFDNIDASQIESVSILKDGEASIYGARAGNGVILITTKRGTTQKPVISVNTSTTMQGVTKMLHTASSGEMAEMQREAWINSGKPDSSAPWTAQAVANFFAGNVPGYTSTDWYNTIFRPWAPEQNHNISVRGGSDKVKYFGYFGYTDQATMIRQNGGDYKRYNVQSKVDADITKNLTLSLDMSLIYEDRLFPLRGLGIGGYSWQDLYTSLPWYPATLPDPTKLSWAGISTGSIYATTNMNLTGYTDQKTTSLTTSGSLVYKIPGIKGLKAKAFVSFYDNPSFSKNWTQPATFYTYNTSTQNYTVAGSYFTNAQLSEGYGRGKIFTENLSLNYDNTFKEDHHISVLALYESTDYDNYSFSGTRINYLTTAIQQLYAGSATSQSVTGNESQMGRLSYVGRLNYSYKNRYLLESVFRADASAKFPASSRWGYFPSVSLGWVLSKEKFMQKFTALDNLKIRGSYGKSGNDAVGNFQYLAGYALAGTSYILGNSAQPQLYTTGLANPNLTWEKISISNLGTDFSFFNRKLFGTAEVFYRLVQGIPGTLAASVPSTFGAGLPTENINSTDDRGIEISLGTSMKSGKVNYEIVGNISWSRAKWVHYDEPVYTDKNQIRLYQNTGKWIDRANGFVANGLFTSQNQINSLTYTYSDLGGNSSLRPGDVIYKDIYGNGVLDWRDQKDIGKGTTPHWNFGLNNTIRYKGFDFTALLQGSFGYSTLVNLQNFYSETEYQLRWTQQTNDPKALVPRLGGAGTNGYQSTYNYKSTEYIRLKSASFGYQIPKKVLEKVNITSARFYVAGTNILTFSSLNKYHIDPEIPAGANTLSYYPQQRSISFGLNLSL